MRFLKYLLAVVALGMASCTEQIIEPRTEPDHEPIPIGEPPPDDP
jgi:hypothetical protein